MSDIMSVWFSSFGIGICTGFTIAFIAWGVGFGIYAIIKWFKMSQPERSKNGKYQNCHEHCVFNRADKCC